MYYWWIKIWDRAAFSYPEAWYKWKEMEVWFLLDVRQVGFATSTLCLWVRWLISQNYFFKARIYFYLKIF